MKILVAYATTDGQTRKIGRFVADHAADAGMTCELLNVVDAAGLNLARFDRAVLIGSLHAGGFQNALTEFAAAHSRRLSQMESLFLPVSLSAAGSDADDWAGVQACVDKFLAETLWQPARIEHVAGAFRFTEYDFFRAWAMRLVAYRKGVELDPDGDKEYTDWAKLARVVSDWLGVLPVAA